MDAEDTSPLWREGEVVRMAGRGEMGEVYQVRHLQRGIDLAAKVPRAEVSLSPGELGQFADEAQNWVSPGLHPKRLLLLFRPPAWRRSRGIRGIRSRRKPASPDRGSSAP